MSSSDTPKTIYLRGTFPTYVEGVAAAAIMPGSLITVDGPVRTVAEAASVALATAATGVSATFARENDLIGGGIDDAYEAGENVLGFVAQPGDMVFARLAAGQNVARGALLSPGAAGALTAAVAGDPEADPPVFPSRIIAKAVDAVNNAAGGAPVRIKIEVV